VPDGRESALASGPTLPIHDGIDACSVIERYGLLTKLPAPIRARFDRPKQWAKHRRETIPRFAIPFFQLLLGRDDLFPPRTAPPRRPGSSPFVTTQNRRLARRARGGFPARAARRVEARESRPPGGCDRGWRGKLTGHGQRRRREKLGVRPAMCGENRGPADRRAECGHDGIDDRARRRSRRDGKTSARARTLGLDQTIIFGEAIRTRLSRSWATRSRQAPRETTCAISASFLQNRLAARGAIFRESATQRTRRITENHREIALSRSVVYYYPSPSDSLWFSVAILRVLCVKFRKARPRPRKVSVDRGSASTYHSSTHGRHDWQTHLVLSHPGESWRRYACGI